LLIEWDRFGPLLSVRPVVAHLGARERPRRVVAGSTRLQQLQDTLPVPEAHTHLDAQVFAVYVRVDGLSLFKALEVHRDLCLLLRLVLQK
jgi:hypothetical protein